MNMTSATIIASLGYSDDARTAEVLKGIPGKRLT